jgi:hypothetical protein
MPKKVTAIDRNWQKAKIQPSRNLHQSVDAIHLQQAVSNG